MKSSNALPCGTAGFNATDALYRARRAADNHLHVWEPEEGEPGDYVARPLVETIAWSAHLTAAEVEMVALESLSARGLHLSDFGRRALPSWSKIAVAERPSRLEWVPAEDVPWPRPGQVDPFDFAAREPSEAERAEGEAASRNRRDAAEAKLMEPADHVTEWELHLERQRPRAVARPGSLLETITERQWARRAAAKPEAVVAAREASEIKPAAPEWKGPLDLRTRLRSVLFNSASEIAPPSWLVKGLVPKSGITLLYGESSAGKTFLAIHLAVCTAWGLPFFGRRLKQAGVVYGAAESGAGVLVRLKAAEAALAPLIAEESRAREARGEPPLQPAPIRVITEAPNLGPDGDARPLMASVEDAKAEIEAAGHRLGMVVLDTWHAVLGGGDDNASSDTGGALRPVRELCDVHGLAALIVGHPGKDSEKGVRGSSALPAAADAIIALVVEGHTGPRPKPSSATRRLTVTKMRDGECGGTAEYRLSVVPLGTDEDGDPWTTCVVEPLGGVDMAKLTSGRLTGQALEALTIIESLADESRRANLDSARQRFIESSKEAKPDAGESAHRMGWDRAVKKLQAAGRIEVFAGENRVQLLDLDP